jgi:cytoskeleton protein RodZ
MSEEELPIRFADSAQAQMDASKSAGQLLREAREAKGLHVAALAVSLKVPVKKLEALEADRLDELPDAVFVRALASSVCRALKTDPAPILEKLPQLNTRVLDQASSGVNVAFRTRADGPAPSALSNLNRPVVLGVLALLLAAIVLMLLPDFSARSAAKATTSAAPNTARSVGVSMGNPVNVPSTPAGSASDATTGVVSPVGANSASANPASLNPARSSPATDTPTLTTLSVTPALSTPKVSSPTLTITPISPANTAATPPPADSVIIFTATGETWIEVKDVAGKIILQRTLQTGEKAGAGPSLGKLPFAVIVGRANLTQVTLRDKAFDLAPVSSKDAVARFQVK